MNFLEGVNVYAVSDTGFKHLEYFRELLAAGADVIQLRDKELSDREFYQLACELKKLSSGYKKFFIVNDRIDIAVAADADGVHVGMNDLPVDAVRGIISDKKILGCTAHNFKEAKEAVRMGADYISVGPIFETETKKGLKPIKIDEAALIKDNINLPQVAIGGIKLENIEQVKSMGFKNAAMIKALTFSHNKSDLISKIRKGLSNDIDRKA